MCSTAINRQLAEEVDGQGTLTDIPCIRQDCQFPREPFKSLAFRVSSKLEDGGFKSAARLACFEDTFSVMNDDTLNALQQKHPSVHPESCILLSPPCSFEVSIKKVVKTIKSFPNGSAGGPDGLRPQHLKDSQASTEGRCQALLLALSSFIGLVLFVRISLVQT